MKKILISFVKLYQKLLSPDHSFWAKAMNKPPYCKHIPSCSEYMIESIEKKGIIKGVLKGTYRIIRCNPWSKGGFDPVENGPIYFYERDYYMFSNFAAFNVVWKGETWSTSEHAYQAEKFEDKKIREEIRNAPSAYESKNISKKYESQKIPNWEEKKLKVMEEIVRAKYAQHQYIQEKLKETGNREIIENSPFDSYWGWGYNKKGLNHLGKIWMKIRDKK